MTDAKFTWKYSSCFICLFFVFVLFLFFNLVFFTAHGALSFLLLFFSGVQKMSREINPSTTNCTQSRILKFFTSCQTNQLIKRGTDIRLASLVYVSTYCVPIALLRQNKPFRLFYLGHAPIITASLSWQVLGYAC